MASPWKALTEDMRMSESREGSDVLVVFAEVSNIEVFDVFTIFTSISYVF